MSLIYISIYLVCIIRNVWSEQCAKLPSDSSILSGIACAGAVNYEFYLPSGYTAETLNILAKKTLNSSELAISPTGCQKAMKNLVCSNIYLKCPSNIELGSNTFTGYNFDIYKDIAAELVALRQNYSFVPTMVPMPFQRPCSSVCTNVIAQCGAFLSLLGTPINCLATTDYSRGSLKGIYALQPSLSKPAQYDAKNDPAICNVMDSVFSVQATKEPYLQANNPEGFCYGMVKELFVPPASVLSSSLAPMQPPYVVQTLIEKQLKQAASALPVYLSRDCKIAIKKYFCGSAMFAPSKQIVSVALTQSGYGAYVGYFPSSLTDYSFYLPSYPHQDVCVEYATACQQFIAIANMDSLTPNCNKSKGGVLSYPSYNQTVSSLTTKLMGQTLNIKFITPPNTMTASTFKTDYYNTKCPDGTVVPNKKDPRTKWVPGTGCAVACKPPLFSLQEWDSFVLQGQIVAFVGLFLVTVFILTWVLDREKRKQYLVICFAAASCFGSVTSAAISLVDFDEVHCATNAVPMDHTDGFTVCSVQMLTMVFCGIWTTAAWTLLAVDVFMKIVLGMRSTNQYKYVFYGILFVIPTCCVIGASQVNYQFVGVVPFCWVNTPGDIAVVIAWMGGMTVIGAVAMASVVIRILMSLMSSATKDSSKMSDKINMVRLPLIFLVVFLILISSFMGYRINISLYADDVQEGLGSFLKCVFKNFDGTQQSWKDACGEHPSNRFSEGLTEWVWFCFIGQSIIVSCIYLLNPSVWKFWLKKCLNISEKVGVESTVYFIAGRKGRLYSEYGSRAGASSSVLVDNRERGSPRKVSPRKTKPGPSPMLMKKGLSNIRDVKVNCVIVEEKNDADEQEKEENQKDEV